MGGVMNEVLRRWASSGKPSAQNRKQILHVVFSCQTLDVSPLNTVFVACGQELGMVRVARSSPMFRRGESLDDQILESREPDRAIRCLQNLRSGQVARIGRFDEIQHDAQPFVQPNATLADEAPREHQSSYVGMACVDHIDVSGCVVAPGVELNGRPSHDDELGFRCAELRGEESGKPETTLRGRGSPGHDGNDLVVRWQGYPPLPARPSPPPDPSQGAVFLRASLKLAVVGKRFSPDPGGSDLESHRRQAAHPRLSLLDACR